MRRRLALIGVTIALVSAPGNVRAGSYAVSACDAAGGATPSWTPQGGSFNSFKACPSFGNPALGMGTRLTGRTFTAGEYSRLWFFAPAGTTIAGLNWSGRWNRDHPSWAVELRAQGGVADQRLTGARPNSGYSYYDGSLGQFWLGAPAGTTRLLQNTQCGAGSCPSGATFHTFAASVVVSDPSAPNADIYGGGLASGRWVRRSASLDFGASDNVGISDASVEVGGRQGEVRRPGCDFTQARPGGDASGALGFATDQLPDGTYPVRLTVADCAGNVTYRDATAKVDNTAPLRVTPGVAGGDGWRSDPAFSVRWKSVPDGFAPIARARYELCQVGGPCAAGARDGPNVEELPVNVSGPGEYRLRVSVEDEAGNVAPVSDPAALRYDPDAPSLAFEEPDPDDPLRVSVATSDATSGVAGGEVEMRLRGGRTWQGLETTLEGQHLVAYVDDERFRNGSYEFRARAYDRAGNERSTDRLASGTRATLHLPVRFSTLLRAGIRRTVRRRAGRGRKRRRTFRYLGRGRVRLSSQVKLRGTLTNRDGQPIDGAIIEVHSRSRYGRRPFALTGTARTDLRGRFSYLARARASRVLRFRYRGTRKIRSATREFTMVVPAASTIATNRRTASNGSQVLFRGRVRGGAIPANGKLTLLQAVVRGQWRTFATPRTNPRGRWSFRYRFAVTRGLVRYRFRLCVPHEAGYPYDTGCSRATPVTVRGP